MKILYHFINSPPHVMRDTSGEVLDSPRAECDGDTKEYSLVARGSAAENGLFVTHAQVQFTGFELTG